MKLIFFVGTGRCGSSLIHEVFCKHSETGFISNIEDNLLLLNRYGRYNNTLYRSLFGDFTKKGSIRFAPSEAYNLITKEVTPIYANSSRDLIDSDVTPWIDKRFKQFFLERNRIQNKTVFTHKYTGWSRMRFFSKIFPNAKFIHIVRDGRAVANSWLQMPWWNGYRGPQNWLWGDLNKAFYKEWADSDFSYITLAGISWKILIQSYHDSEEALSTKNYLPIKYEDIVTEPEMHFNQILDFSCLDSNTLFDKILNNYTFSRNRLKSYENDLSTSQVDELNKSLGDILQQYNYR